MKHIVRRIAPSVISETKSNGTVKKYIPIEIEIVLPKSAILMDKDEINYVYVVDQNGAAKKIPIHIKTATKTEAMVEGINEEQKIITSNLEEMQEGTKIRYLK